MNEDIFALSMVFLIFFAIVFYFSSEISYLYARQYQFLGLLGLLVSLGFVIYALVKKEEEDIEKAKTPSKPVQIVSIADEIRKLAELRDADILSNEEFEERKKKLLE